MPEDILKKIFKPNPSDSIMDLNLINTGRKDAVDPSTKGTVSTDPRLYETIGNRDSNNTQTDSNNSVFLLCFVTLIIGLFIGALIQKRINRA